LMILRDFAHDTKMITKRQRRLTLTKTTIAALADPDLWWRHVVAGWFTGNDFTVEVVELAAATIPTGTSTNQIVDAATEFVAPRYRLASNHTHPTGAMSNTRYGTGCDPATASASSTTTTP
jgi:hypothetical protein